MKISTRKLKVTGISVGTGSYQLNCTEEQLKIIASLLYITRLGTTGFPNAASDLGEAIEIAIGDKDFSQQAWEEVKPYVTETDDRGYELRSIQPDNLILELE